MSEPFVFKTVSAYRQWLAGVKAGGLVDGAGAGVGGGPVIGFVPTMGALHEGHAALMRQAKQECDLVVVSIFVNPLQFGPNEDFDRYPRALAQDLQLCQREGVAAVFHPDVQEMYPRPLEQITRVIPPARLIDHLCGAFRPGHFEGVATVVMQLLNIIAPDRAYFGQKDYQQLAVINTMVCDLRLPVQVVGVPTVRDADGLALSSRNAYLSAEERKLAPVLAQALKHVLDALSAGDQPDAALEAARRRLESVPGLELQYLAVCDAETLEPLLTTRRPLVALVAAKLGSVRLIDNMLLL